MTNPDPALPDPQRPEADARLQALEAQVQALQASEAQARALFLNAPVAALLLTPDGVIHEGNTLAYEWLALPSDAPDRHDFRSLLTAGTQAGFDDALHQLQAGLPRQSIEARLAQEGRSDLDMRLDLALQQSPGQPDLLYLVITDRTDHPPVHRPLPNRQEASPSLHTGDVNVPAQPQELEAVIRADLQVLYLPASRIMTAAGLLRHALGDQAEHVERPVVHIERGGQQLIAIIQDPLRS